MPPGDGSHRQEAHAREPRRAGEFRGAAVDGGIYLCGAVLMSCRGQAVWHAVRTEEETDGDERM